MNVVNVGYRSTNYYVLSDGKPRLLIDAGWPGSMGAMQHACKTMGIRLEEIPYQLATHYHPDHAGLSEELKRLGVRLIVMDTQVDFVPLLQGHTKPSDNFTPITTKGNIIVRVAESRRFLAGIGIEGEIISTPGHSEDCVTLILDEGRAAFIGDMTPLVMAPDDPNDTGYQNWVRIRALGVKTIYPGHGPAQQLGE